MYKSATMSSPILYYTLLLLGSCLCNKTVFALTIEDKIALYENCTIFDTPDIYGGLICGDNGATYANSLYLDCKNHHDNSNVATLHSGPCLENEKYCNISLYYDPVCGSDRKIYVNLQSLLCTRNKYAKVSKSLVHVYAAGHALYSPTTYPAQNTVIATPGNYFEHTNFNLGFCPRNLTVVTMENCEQQDHCYREGIEHYGTNPVCANNGLTYQNVAQLKCLQRYNQELQIVHDGGCRVEFVHRLYGASVCNIARVRYEWNPVCASDGITYPNPFLFLCHQPQLQVISNGECNTHSHDACVEAHTNATLLENGEYVNDDFTSKDEVCGSDGRTYNSIYHLQCQTSHNKYLFLKHHGPCSGPDDHPCGSIPEEEHRQPICGTDGKTYVSPEALWCAKLRSSTTDLVYKHDGPC